MSAWLIGLHFVMWRTLILYMIGVGLHYTLHFDKSLPIQLTAKQHNDVIYTAYCVYLCPIAWIISFGNWRKYSMEILSFKTMNGSLKIWENWLKCRCCGFVFHNTLYTICPTRVFHHFLATSMTDWAQIFTGLLF